MSNRLSMATHQSITTLHRSGHSNREIARLLKIDRGAVNKYVRQIRAESQAQNGADSGSEDVQNRPNAPTGFPGSEQASPEQNRPPATEPPIGFLVPEKTETRPLESSKGVVRSGPKSLCGDFLETIEKKLDEGLSAVRIHQDLRIEYGFEGSYFSVRRFIQSLGKKTPLPFRRMETEPGQEAQIDFGTGAYIIDADGRKRRPWMFRIVLSCSRKGYSEVVWRQTTDNFIAAIENSFHFFGGVPKTLVIDNLKAAVQKADWYDPEIHPGGTARQPKRATARKHDRIGFTE